MQAYIQRLAAYNVDLQEYMTWSIRQPAAQIETIDPAEVLTKIKESSSTDLNAVADLGIGLNNVIGNVIPLAQDKQRRFLVGSDTSALSLGQFVPLSDDDDVDTGIGTTTEPTEQTPPSHPLIVELSTPNSSSSAQPSQQSSGALTLPRYVVVLGRLLIHDLRNINDVPADEQPTTDVNPDYRPMEATNYAVVMDAVSKTRSIWLVYNRAPTDLEAGCQIQSAPTDEDQHVLFPPSENFDSAMVMSDLQTWNVGASLLSLESVAEVVATSKSSVPVVAAAAPRDAVNTALGR